LLLAATGLFLVIGLVLADWWQANREMDHLLDAVFASELALGTGAANVTRSINTGFSDAYQSQSQRQAAFGEVATKCGVAAADAQDAGAQASEVFLLPWHRSLGKAQDAYLAHNAAWEHKFSACADDAQRYGDGSTSAQISATFRTAHRAFTNALPPGDESDRSRIEAIFKD